MKTAVLRWKIALLLCAAVAISYFDRQTLSVAIKAIEGDIKLSPNHFAMLNTAFLVAYALMYAAGGKLIDVLGTRRGFFIIMVWWSLACASHGLALSFGMLAVSRFLLGTGEGGGFPAATKAVAEWFPVHERSTAMGIINAGTAIGGVVAAPLIAAILQFARWPWVFYFSGACGLLWTLWWMLSYYSPAQHPRISPEEKECLSELSAHEPDGPDIPWIALFRFPEVWGLVSAKFLTDAAWYFYLFWLPKYLYDTRGFDVKSVGLFAWMPFAFAGLGCLAGGWSSSFMIKRGCSLNFSRKVTLGVSAFLMPLVFFVTRSPIQAAIGIFCIAYFGQQSWSTLVMILPADLFPRRAVGSVAGLVGFGGAMGGVVWGQTAGWMLGNLKCGYGPVFAISSSFHLLAFGLILLTIRKVQPLVSEGRLENAKAVAV
jgi:ACS family hexuronate transporter-like MFS transporter